MDLRRPGRLILLTGPSGAGKTTLGRLLVRHLTQFGPSPATLVDGDSARSFFEGGLGYGAVDRDEATRRLAFGAFTLVAQGHDVVLANIAGTRAVRAFLRRKFPELVEVHLDVDVATLAQHDVKGVYARAAREGTPLVGVDLPYEAPERPDVVVHPYQETPEQSLQRVLTHLAGRGPSIGSKADTLASLAGHVRRFRVLPQGTLTFAEWESNPAHTLERLRDALGAGPWIVRSSCAEEDNASTSNAGRFLSVPGVAAEREAFAIALAAVRDDYAEQGVERPDHAQVLVQPLLTDVAASGVVFTRHATSDSPYYVVSYDDESGRTDTVTAGTGGRTVYVSRTVERERVGRWRELIEAVRELEHLVPGPLDVEWAELASGALILLQCRRLHVEERARSLEEDAAVRIQELGLRFERVQAPAPPLCGARTVLSDMADWNPAEMLGDRPRTLAYTIYRAIVTDEVWHRARASQGYCELSGAPLLVSIGRKPYVDTRASFNSFVPADVRPEVRARLVDAWTARLAQHKELHDKVEFDVASTCFDLDTAERLRALDVLDADERAHVEDALRGLTDRLVSGGAQAIAADLARLDRLDALLEEVHEAYRGRRAYWESFHAAWLLLEHVKPLGTLPFARLARLGFVARALLRSLERHGALPADGADRLVRGVRTVASELQDDLARHARGELPRAALLARYGHLRMSTYDITALRYDQMPDSVWRAHAPEGPAQAEPNDVDEAALDRALRAAGLGFDGRTLLEFAEAATRARELGKFRFTRAVSDALELVARGGEALGLGREDLQHLNLATVTRFRNPEDASPARAAAYLRGRIEEKREERGVYDLIQLPSVIASPRDLEVVEVLASRPNFVTRRRVVAEVVPLAPDARPGDVDLRGKVVAIPSADPGYDWIFGQGLAGLVTRFGGVASHMAIRCLEFDLPGAIGCGEKLFEAVTAGRMLLLDCAEGKVERV